MFYYGIVALAIVYMLVGTYQLLVRNEFGVAVAMFCAAAAIVYVGATPL